MPARLAFALCLLTTGVRAATLSVPHDFSSISAAVEAAAPGDTIEIAAGVYSPLDTGETYPLILEEDIVIRGAGAGRTVLDAQGMERLFVVRTAAVLEDLTLRGGSTSEVGGAVWLDGEAATLSRLEFLENAALSGGAAIALENSDALVENCVFADNGPTGPTVWIDGGRPHLRQLTFHENGGATGAVLAGEPRWETSIMSRPGVPRGPAIGLRVSASALPDLRDNLWEGCFDATVQAVGKPSPALEDALATARRRDGLREGEPRFRRPESGDFRLRDGSPARRGDGELGAFGGERPLAARDPLRIDSDEEGSEDEASLLGPSVPNPFTPTTTIHFTVADAVMVDLGVYNILGQRVRTLHVGELAAGEHSRVWDGRDDAGIDAPPGIYFVRVTQGNVTESQRVTLVR